MREAERIKKYYCRPAVTIGETEWRQLGMHGKLPVHFHVERFIWVDKLLPEWRVAIPEEVSQWAKDEDIYRTLHGGIQTRMITYIPTGKTIYDNSLPPATAVVFEYELEQFSCVANKLPAHLRRS